MEMGVNRERNRSPCNKRNFEEWAIICETCLQNAFLPTADFTLWPLSEVEYEVISRTTSS